MRRNQQGEYDVWQRWFQEDLILDHRDFTGHMDYIHFNPVKHGLASRPVDWPWSSLHRYIRQGIVPPSWAVGVDQGQFGERWGSRIPLRCIRATIYTIPHVRHGNKRRLWQDRT